MDAKKKTTLAASLALLWAGLVVWQWQVFEEPVHVPLTNVTGSASSGRQAEGRGTGLHVHLDRLTSASSQREISFTTPRNIFAVPGPDGTLSLSSDPAESTQPGSISAETLAEQSGAIESGQYRYLGFLRLGMNGRGNGDIAVLRKDDEVLALKVGDRVADHLMLKAITAESVTLRDTGTRIDQTVLLSEEPSSQE